MSNLITPVTPALMAELTNTYNLMHSIESQKQKHNDQDSFPLLAHQLEALAGAILSAAAAAPLMGVNAPSARFDLASDELLSKTVTRGVGYLRDTAGPQLRGNNFSRYDRQKADEALAKLETLYVTTRVAILAMAKSDLKVVFNKAPVDLVAAAQLVADLAAGVKGASN